MSRLINLISRIFLLLIVLGFPACSSEPELKQEAPAVNEVAAGSKFRIALPEDHTTGYTWQLNDNFDKNVVEHMNTAWHGNEKGVYFHFKAGAPGQATLSFINRKYTDTSNVKTFIIKIIAK